MHDILGELAWRSLSKSDQLRYGLSNDISVFAPAFMRRFKPHNMVEKVRYYSGWMDFMGWQSQSWKKTPQYLMSNGQPVPHGLSDHNLNTCVTSWALHDQESVRKVLRRFISKAVNAIRQDNMEGAFCYLGVLLHFIQDAMSPAHMFPNTLFYELSPDEVMYHPDYHKIIDTCPLGEEALLRLKTETPALLGATIAEVVFRTAMLMENDYLYAKKHLFGLLELCRNKDKKAMALLVKPLLQSAVFIAASLFHTLLALGTKRLSKAELKTIHFYDLLEAVPYNIHPGGRYRNLMIGKTVSEDGRLETIRIRGQHGLRKIERALAFSAFNAFRYLLEPGAFRRFEGTLALPCTRQNQQEKEMAVNFFIGTDRTYNQLTASDLEYGPTMKKVYEVKVAHDWTPRPFAVDLKKAKTLMVGAISYPAIVNGKEKCYFPDLILINPRLIK